MLGDTTATPAAGPTLDAIAEVTFDRTMQLARHHQRSRL